MGVLTGEDGSITLPQDTIDQYNNAIMFGLTGYINPNSTDTNEGAFTINIINWYSNDSYAEQEYLSMINGLEKIYGDSTLTPQGYYIWYNVDECQYALCDLMDDGIIHIKWLK